MKKILLLSLLGFAVLSGYAQNMTLPDPVSQAFATRFPKAKKVKWTPEDVNEYAAIFENDSITAAALFEGDGKWIYTSVDQALTRLPLSLTTALKKSHPKSKIHRAAKVSHYKKGEYYEVELKTKDVLETFYFDQDGKEVR